MLRIKLVKLDAMKEKVTTVIKADCGPIDPTDSIKAGIKFFDLWITKPILILLTMELTIAIWCDQLRLGEF